MKNSWNLNSKDLYESLDDLKRLRPLVQPNSNFMRQLVKWESDVSKTNIEPYNPYDFFSYQVGMECYNTPMAGNNFNYPCGILLCLTWSSAQAWEGSNKGSNSRKAHEMINILREKHFLKDCGICLIRGPNWTQCLQFFCYFWLL